MKNWILFLALNMTIGWVYAQEFEKPKEGAQIHLSSYEVDIEPTDEIKLDVWVVRSEKARKSKFDTPKFLGSDDLSIEVEQDKDNKDHYIATVTSKGVANGSYFYTVSSRSRSIQKVKGTTVTFNIGKAKTITKSNK